MPSAPRARARPASSPLASASTGSAAQDARQLGELGAHLGVGLISIVDDEQRRARAPRARGSSAAQGRVGRAACRRRTARWRRARWASPASSAASRLLPIPRRPVIVTSAPVPALAPAPSARAATPARRRARRAAARGGRSSSLRQLGRRAARARATGPGAGSPRAGARSSGPGSTPISSTSVAARVGRPRAPRPAARSGRARASAARRAARGSDARPRAAAARRPAPRAGRRRGRPPRASRARPAAAPPAGRSRSARTTRTPDRRAAARATARAPRAGAPPPPRLPGGQRASPVLDEGLEALGVELTGAHPQLVAGRRRRHDLRRRRAPCAAARRHLHRLARSAGVILAPQRLDEPLRSSPARWRAAAGRPGPRAAWGLPGLPRRARCAPRAVQGHESPFRSSNHRTRPRPRWKVAAFGSTRPTSGAQARSAPHAQPR